MKIPILRRKWFRKRRGFTTMEQKLITKRMFGPRKIREWTPLLDVLYSKHNEDRPEWSRSMAHRQRERVNCERILHAVGCKKIFKLDEND